LHYYTLRVYTSPTRLTQHKHHTFASKETPTTTTWSRGVRQRSDWLVDHLQKGCKVQTTTPVSHRLRYTLAVGVTVLVLLLTAES